MTLAEASAVSELGPGVYRGEVHDGWDIGGNANGGYLIAIAARAMLLATDRDDPVTVTSHYLRPGRPGPVDIAVEVVKEGKRFSTARATMTAADGTPILTVLGTFGSVPGPGDDAGPTFLDGRPPDLPDPDQCLRRADRARTEGPPQSFAERLGVSLHPEDARFEEGGRSGRAEIRGWFELLDDEPIDTVALLLATDAFPPTVFNIDIPVAWVPTVELTTHVRGRPAPGPLACRFATRFVQNGFLEEESEVWDRAGRLVAQSRQLALLPRA